MNSIQDKCICPPGGYSPTCPQSFVQGGQLLHTLGDEISSRKQADQTPTDAQMLEDIKPLSRKGTASSDDWSTSSLSAMESEVRSDPLMFQLAGVTRREDPLEARTKYMTETDFQNERKSAFKKFEALTVNGQKFTDYTIGGYGSAPEVLKEKLEEFIPLPPVLLPVIFADKSLNFSHHFFQGLEILLGRDYVHRMATELKYSESDTIELLPAIRGLITSGAKESDTDLTTFVKRILSATFNTLPAAAETGGEQSLIVATNLYGFQYIEGGMKMNDSSLRMWIHLNYSTYRISWFNAFKSSGIPSFANDGVQDRFDARKKDYTPDKQPAMIVQSSVTQRQLEPQKERRRHRTSSEKESKQQNRGFFASAKKY